MKIERSSGAVTPSSGCLENSHSWPLALSEGGNSSGNLTDGALFRPHREELIRSAMALGVLGFRTIPIFADAKRPALRGWQAKASNTAQAVKELFESCPRADGLAIVPDDGLFVVDLDRGHAPGVDGIRSFGAVASEHGPLEQGPRVATPSGGLHLYFRTSDKGLARCRAAVKPGIDIRGAGGLVAAPPTSRSGRSYRWIVSPWDAPVPEAPRWVLDLVTRQPFRPRDKASLRPFSGTIHPYARTALTRELRAVAGAESGSRNAVLFCAAARLGGLCAGGHLPARSVAALLAEAASECGLLADDGAYAIEATIASGFRHGLQEPRSIPRRRS
jgi:hypothetical protein